MQPADSITAESDGDDLLVGDRAFGLKHWQRGLLLVILACAAFARVTKFEGLAESVDAAILRGGRAAAMRAFANALRCSLSWVAALATATCTPGETR